MKFLLVLLVVGLVSCDKGAKTPEGLIKLFVSEVTSKKVDKEFFEKYTTGKLLESVNQLEESEMEEFLDKSMKRLTKVQNPKIEISNKVCAGEKCTVTYIVKFDFKNKEEGDFESEIKKVATVVKDGETWKISEVSNVKSYYNAQQPINALEENDIPSGESDE